MHLPHRTSLSLLQHCIGARTRGESLSLKGYGGPLKQFNQSHVCVKFSRQSCVQFCKQEGMSPDVEEIVIQANSIDAQNLPPRSATRRCIGLITASAASSRRTSDLGRGRDLRSILPFCVRGKVG